MRAFTEADAAREFARAWNRLDPADFLKRLMPEARYASQWVFEELAGKSAIADYLTAKMRTVKNHALHNPDVKVFAELGKTTTGFIGRDCVFMAQGRKENLISKILQPDEANGQGVVRWWRRRRADGREAYRDETAG